MAQNIGADIIEIERIGRILTKYGQNFCRKIFTPIEIAYCYSMKNPVPSLAVRFAAKEAVAKVLGTGFRGISWQDIEIASLPGGQPAIKLYGKAQELADEKGIKKWLLSLSHSKTQALAIVIGE